MPTYTFELKDGSGGAEDTNGVTLRNRDEAHDYAWDVVQELMRGRERQTRTWQLDVYESAEHILTIPFAQVDPTRDHLPGELRSLAEAASERRRSVAELFHDARLTIRESRALVARSRGKLYVASDRGRTTIRDS